MIYDILGRWADSRPDGVAIVDESRALNYGELFAEVNRAAAFLQSLGCETGDRMIVAVPPSSAFHTVFFAGAALGLVTLPALPSGKIPEIIARSEPRIAVGGQAVLEAVRRRCPTVKHLIEWKASTGLRIPSGDGRTEPTAEPDAPVLGVFSSGSTGEASLYLRSQRTIVERAALRARVHGFRSADVMFATRPYISGSAINSHIMMPLYLGCEVVVQERFERFKAARAITENRVTVLYAVPLIFELLTALPRSAEIDFSSLRLCISGSAALSKAVARQFRERFGVAIRQRYSGSHFHPAFSFNADGPVESVGRRDGVFPLVVLGDDGGVAATGRSGEIAFDIESSPAEFRAVLRANPNRRGNLLHTGDIGKIDDRGNLYILGRKSVFIKVGGNRVEPAEVEHVLRAHPLIKEAVVFGTDRGTRNEAVAAAVAADDAPTYRDLYNYCRDRLASYKCPSKIIFFRDLPRNEHGKVARHLLEHPSGESARRD